MNYLNNINISNCEGSVFVTVTGKSFKILKYTNSKNVLIEFVDTGYVKTCQMKEVRTGSIKDASLPSLYGVGIIGSKYKTKVLNENNKYSSVREYSCWSGLIERCYSKTFLKKRPTYAGCYASENFKHYEYFYDWCNNQIGYVSTDNKGLPFHLDKDILVKGNKCYSEDTCVFVPHDINVALCNNVTVRGKYPLGVHWCNIKKMFIAQVNTGKHKQDYLGMFKTPEEAFYAYKQAKEAYIKNLAIKWKDQIDPRAYEALMKYQVEITD